MGGSVRLCYITTGVVWALKPPVGSCTYCVPDGDGIFHLLEWYGTRTNLLKKKGLEIAMSNQRSFKIGSFRFAAFVPKKIECKRF
jgi:hypothetical protein